MKLFNTFIFSLLTLFQSVSAQVEIAKNSLFLNIDSSEEFIFYFQANSAEPDEYIEGDLIKYEVKNGFSSKLNEETYIFDLLNTKIFNDFLIISDGSNIIKYNIKTNENQLLYKANSSELINDFCLVEDNIIISIKNSESNKHIVLNYDITAKSNNQIYCVSDESKGEFLMVKVLSNKNQVFFLSIDGRLYKYNLSNKKTKQIDKDVDDIYLATDKELYFLKERSILEYNLENNKKLDIIDSENLNITFFDTYKNGLFVGVNDNILVYNKAKNSAKTIDVLPKSNYVYFSENYAVSTNENGLIFLLKNN